MSRNFLLVRAGARLVGLPLAHLVEVIEPGDCYPVPSREPAVRGVVTLRDRAVPLVQLAALLEGRAAAGPIGGTAVICAVGPQRVALEVDDAHEVLADAGLPVPPEASLPWASAVVRRPEGLIPLLDLPALGARLTERGVAT